MPAWAVPVAVVVAMTAIASLIALACKGRPFDTGAAEHEYDQEGRMEYRRMLPGAAFSLASLFSGAAIGPEAPLVDINGGLGTLLADRMGLKPEQVKMMAYAGVAGALAAFLGGAPVGALLAMEFISPKAISMSRTRHGRRPGLGRHGVGDVRHPRRRAARGALPVPRLHRPLSSSISRSRSHSACSAA